MVLQISIPLLSGLNSICFFIIYQWCMVSRYSRSNAMQRANDIQFGNTSLILALSLVCPNRSVTPIAKCNSTLAHKALLQISSCCCRMLSLGLGRCHTPPDYRYQSLSMASFAPPYFEARFSYSCRPCFSRSSSISIKGIRLPPPIQVMVGAIPLMP